MGRLSVLPTSTDRPVRAPLFGALPGVDRRTRENPPLDQIDSLLVVLLQNSHIARRPRRREPVQRGRLGGDQIVDSSVYVTLYRRVQRELCIVLDVRLRPLRS